LNRDLKEEIKKERKKNQVKSDIFQAVSHTLNNLISVENSIIKRLPDIKNLETNIRKLELFQLIMSSILNSIQVVFSNNKELHNINIYKRKRNNNIRVSSAILFALNLNINHLLKGIGKWEGIYNLFFDITEENEDLIDDKIEDIFKNEFFNISELTDMEMNNFKDYFFSSDMEFLSRYFTIDFELLDTLYVEKEDYSFALFFIIFQELIKNMFKYGTIVDKENQKFNIFSKKDGDDYLIVIENHFNKDSSSIMRNTLQGFKMVKMFSEILGGFSKTEENDIFRVEITINNNLIK